MAGDSDKRGPGERFRAPLAETWNNMVEAGYAYRDARLSQQNPQRTRPRDTNTLKVKNDSGDDLRKGEILRIDDTAITTMSDEYSWVSGVEPDKDCFFGILKEPILDGKIGTMQIDGRCLALVDINNANDTHANLVDGSYVLESTGKAGPIEILYKPSGTGELECLVRFGGTSHPMTFVKIPTGGISAATASGATPSVTSCTFYENTGTNGALVQKTVSGGGAYTDNVLNYFGAVGTLANHDYEYLHVTRSAGGWVLTGEGCNDP